MLSMSREDFEDLVSEALDGIPAELFELIRNVAILVEDDAPDGDPNLLGLYHGVPLTSRDSGYSGVLPDRILIFRNPILRLCMTREDAVREVRTTVVHEIAHYFGIDDEHLDELGYG